MEDPQARACGEDPQAKIESPMAHKRAEGRRDREEDRDFWIDKEGIPHWNGVDMVHLKQYRARVRLEYEAILGDSDWANERRATLGLRLTRGLTLKAWEAVESLFLRTTLP